MSNTATTTTATKFDVSVSAKDGDWVVTVKGKVASRHDSFDKAFEQWAELTRELPAFRG